jgi:hypothetical protein
MRFVICLLFVGMAGAALQADTFQDLSFPNQFDSDPDSWSKTHAENLVPADVGVDVDTGTRSGSVTEKSNSVTTFEAAVSHGVSEVFDTVSLNSTVAWNFKHSCIWDADGDATVNTSGWRSHSKMRGSGESKRTYTADKAGLVTGRFVFSSSGSIPGNASTEEMNVTATGGTGKVTWTWDPVEGEWTGSGNYWRYSTVTETNDLVTHSPDPISGFANLTDQVFWTYEADEDDTFPVGAAVNHEGDPASDGALTLETGGTRTDGDFTIGATSAIYTLITSP